MVRDNGACKKLGLEGERLCREKNYLKGIELLKAAIKVGTDDLNILSVIYCQLGNAYFHLKDYESALRYHKFDLTLVIFTGDQSSQAKAMHNLGNTCKVMGKYSEAITWFKRFLDKSKEIDDRIAEIRGLHLLGNVYYIKGKKKAQKEGYEKNNEYSEGVRQNLFIALKYYRKCLELLSKFEDTNVEGQILGCVGNVYFILGDFDVANQYFKEELEIIASKNDMVSLRRTHANLAKTYIFLYDYENAIKHYKESLLIAKILKNLEAEAKICYYLANTYALLQDCTQAVDLYLRNFEIVSELDDQAARGRVCWCLSNVYSDMGNYETALFFANLHLQISKNLEDLEGLHIAREKFKNLSQMMAFDRTTEKETISIVLEDKEIPVAKEKNFAKKSSTEDLSKSEDCNEDDILFEQITCLQSSRIEDQRYDKKLISKKSTMDEDDILDQLERLQSNRMDEQRVVLPFLPNVE